MSISSEHPRSFILFFPRSFFAAISNRNKTAQNGTRVACQTFVP